MEMISMPAACSLEVRRKNIQGNAAEGVADTGNDPFYRCPVHLCLNHILSEEDDFLNGIAGPTPLKSITPAASLAAV